MDQVPLPVFSGTTALVLFAAYLRFRQRVSTPQMLVLMAVALLVGWGMMQVYSASAGQPPVAGGAI